MLIKELKNCKTKQTVNVKGLIKQIDVNQTKNGKDFTAVVLQDKTGNIIARKWDRELIGVWKEGDIVDAVIETSFYGENNSFISFNLKSGTLLNNEDSKNYENAFTPEIDKMKEYLRETIAEIYQLNPAMKEVINPLFNQIDTNGDFFKVPAAKSMHHDGKGGLLFHTTSILHHVSKLADSAEECYGEKVDRALLYTAVILHDFFKIREYNLNEAGGADVTKYALTGHIGEAIKYIGWLEYTNAIDKELSLRLAHIVEAHHGKLEWGSPVVPMTIEAFIMFIGDFFDSRMYMYKSDYNRLEENELSSQYSKGLETYVYRPGNR